MYCVCIKPWLQRWNFIRWLSKPHPPWTWSMLTSVKIEEAITRKGRCSKAISIECVIWPLTWYRNYGKFEFIIVGTHLLLWWPSSFPPRSQNKRCCTQTLGSPCPIYTHLSPSVLEEFSVEQPHTMLWNRDKDNQPCARI